MISPVTALIFKKIDFFDVFCFYVRGRIYQGGGISNISRIRAGEIFPPLSDKNENLIGIGITEKHQGPSFNVWVSDEEKRDC